MSIITPGNSFGNRNDCTICNLPTRNVHPARCRPCLGPRCRSERSAATPLRCLTPLAAPALVPAAGPGAAPLRPYTLSSDVQPSTFNVQPSHDHRLICRRQRSRSVVTTSPDGVSTSGGVSTCAPYARYLLNGLEGSLEITPAHRGLPDGTHTGERQSPG